MVRELTVSVPSSTGAVRVAPPPDGQSPATMNVQARPVRGAILALALICGGACRGIEPIEAPPTLDGPELARAQLGQRLFFEGALARDGDTACASCHAAKHGGGDGQPTSTGVDEQVGRRNAPSVYNASLKFRQFWDGRGEDLDRQALGPLFSPEEMDMDEALVQQRLRASPSYEEAFAAAFPGDPDPVRATNVSRALAAYMRQLAWPGRVDRFLAGEESALTALERRGYEDFTGNCAFCHDGPGVGGQRFEKLGEEQPWPWQPGEDRGREEITGEPGDRLVFVVPSLRHVAQTAPYFHDGSVATLEEAIRLMGKHQLGESLSPERVDALAAFLRALDGEIPPALLTSPEGAGL